MRKLASIVSLVAICAFALVGCKSNNSVEGAGEGLKVYSMQQLKDYCKDGKAIEVSFWHSFGKNITTPLEELIDAFEADMKEEGINIEVTATSTGGGYDGLRSRVNMGIKSNSIPTMLLGYPDHFANYIDANILMPLDEFVNSTEEGVGISDTSDFVKSYWDENQMLINGKKSVAGIPFNKSTEVMYYNASVVDPILVDLGIVEAAGDSWDQPTWDELWQVSAKIQEKVAAKNLTWELESGTFVADYAQVKYPVIIDSPSNFFITASRQWGGEGYYTRLQDGSSEGEVVFNNSKVVEAQTYFLAKANDNLWQLPNKLNQGYGSSLMQNLQSFISIGSTAGVKNNDSKKYELQVTQIPQRSYDDTTNQAVIQQGTNAAILTANSNNYTRAAAWQLIKYLTNTENTAKFSIATGYLPVRESAVESDSYQAFLGNTESIFNGNVAKAINAAYAQKDYFYTDVAFSGSSIVRDKVETGLVIPIYLQNKPIAKALDDMYTALEKLDIKCTKLS